DLFLVGVEIRGDEHLLALNDSLSELGLLADTAGLQVVGRSTQHLEKPNVKTYIGSGKVDEVRMLAEEVKANVILFDNELSPRHLRELELEFGNHIRVLDRTALILDIFAQHANTNEGSLQVELAQYEYRLPRLTRAWTHLARQAGGGAGRSGAVGGVGLRGPGETQLEVDRREIRTRIKHLKEQIEKMRIHRQQYRSRRKKSLTPVVALVGYTNAGKSTLLNRLSKSDVYVADKLFATLDPTTRRVSVSDGHIALITDTVGFIQKLPTMLVAAFRATLEEIAEADLLIHVIDITHPQAHEQARAVYQTLVEIEADHIPILTALNKIDNLTDPDHARQAVADFPGAVAISALSGEGLPELLQKAHAYLYENYISITIFLPYQEGGLITLFHEQGQVEKVGQVSGGVEISGKIPGRLLSFFHSFLKEN
ncbi:MAG TPA: GTPase HflX, partial [Anaerolineales bacterium]|nr:GTPase HflX [Anaerolineales bacterium]